MLFRPDVPTSGAESGPASGAGRRGGWGRGAPGWACALLALAAGLGGCAGGQSTRYRGGPTGTGGGGGASAVAASPGAPSPSWSSSAAPTGRPVAPVTFRFDVGDEIATGVWTEPELSSSQRLLADGTISPPLLKPQRVVGRTVEEVQAQLTAAYREFLKEPRVSVRVVSIHSDRVFVLGEVRTPQAVSLVGPLTALQSVAAAGGFQEEYAEKSRVLVLRVGADGRPSPVAVDARAVLSGRQADLPLQRGDIVYVPARGVTEFARTVGQALSPLTSAIGSASSVGALIVAGQN